MKVASSYTIVVLVAGLLIIPVQGQTVSNCEPRSAQAELNIGNGRFPAGHYSNHVVYRNTIPAGSGLSSIYSLKFAMAGIRDDSLRTAGSVYGLDPLWAGPITPSGQMPSDCHLYDRIFSVSEEDIEAIHGSNTTADILDWPYHLGAPVADGDGIPDNYDIELGDRPALLGEQMLWWLANDMGGQSPLGIEIRTSMFAFGEPSRPLWLSNSTFIRIQVTNKQPSPISDAWIGAYMDADLGHAWDDYVGSDTSVGMGYFYNADSLDGWTEPESYLDRPPAVGLMVLKGPLKQSNPVASGAACSSSAEGSRHRLTNFFAMLKSGDWRGEPSYGESLYFALQSRYKNGRPQTVGGAGWDVEGATTVFSYPGNPISGDFWSEMNSDGSGTKSDQWDRRAMYGVGPFCLGPGETDEVVFALHWARGADHLDSVRLLLEEAQAYNREALADAILTPLSIPVSESPEPGTPYKYGLPVYPNPFSLETTIEYSMPRNEAVRLVIYDVLGRVVETLVDKRQDSGEYSISFSGEALPSGIYFYRLNLGQFSSTRKMVLNR